MYNTTVVGWVRTQVRGAGRDVMLCSLFWVLLLPLKTLFPLPFKDVRT